MGVGDHEIRRDAELAYEAIAPVYDDFTAHHNFDLWLNNFLPKLELHGLSGHQLLDVACGTGKSFLSMVERGWEVTGCDVSTAMVEKARAKAGLAVNLLVADMRELPVLGAFDLVWCLDDALNYLLSEDELVSALEGMRKNLGIGGLLLFDVNTIEVFRTFFAERVVVEHAGRRLIWQGLSSPSFAPESIAEARFSVEPQTGLDSVVPTHVHRERHFPEHSVLRALDRAGLECLDVFGHRDDAIPNQPLDEHEHTKAVYLARTNKAQS